MNGATLSDLKKPLPLGLCQVANEGDPLLDSIHDSFLTTAAIAICGILENVRSTSTFSSGQFFRSAYIRAVMLVQAPNAAITNSYGLGPASAPPTPAGSSANSW